MARWVVPYLALAWLVLQVVDVLGEIWGWPLPAQRAASLALGGGLLPVWILAWYQGERGRRRTG